VVSSSQKLVAVLVALDFAIFCVRVRIHADASLGK
jgi:hypothetical protein